MVIDVGVLGKARVALEDEVGLEDVLLAVRVRHVPAEPRAVEERAEDALRGREEHGVRVEADEPAVGDFVGRDKVGVPRVVALFFWNGSAQEGVGVLVEEDVGVDVEDLGVRVEGPQHELGVGRGAVAPRLRRARSRRAVFPARHHRVLPSSARLDGLADVVERSIVARKVDRREVAHAPARRERGEVRRGQRAGGDGDALARRADRVERRAERDGAPHELVGRVARREVQRRVRDARDQRRDAHLRRWCAGLECSSSSSSRRVIIKEAAQEAAFLFEERAGERGPADHALDAVLARGAQVGVDLGELRRREDNPGVLSDIMETGVVDQLVEAGDAARFIGAKELPAAGEPRFRDQSVRCAARGPFGGPRRRRAPVRRHVGPYVGEVDGNVRDRGRRGPVDGAPQRPQRHRPALGLDDRRETRHHRRVAFSVVVEPAIIMFCREHGARVVCRRRDSAFLGSSTLRARRPLAASRRSAAARRVRVAVVVGTTTLVGAGAVDAAAVAEAVREGEALEEEDEPSVAVRRGVVLLEPSLLRRVRHESLALEFEGRAERHRDVGLVSREGRESQHVALRHVRPGDVRAPADLLAVPEVVVAIREERRVQIVESVQDEVGPRPEHD
mmetsp:Transcript_7395/g.30609  ORF Transcript_7395/g.30609 Transcript_7395/m.30609 type:complete len:620 (-) Transcript_7395:537-2396(-)